MKAFRRFTSASSLRIGARAPSPRGQVQRNFSELTTIEVNPALKKKNVKAEANVVEDGRPPERRVMNVHMPATKNLQAGRGKFRYWTISTDKSNRWQNELMNWTSFGDPYSILDLKFDTKDQAIAYCKRYGWNYRVTEPVQWKDTKMKGKISYGHNFLSTSVEAYIQNNHPAKVSKSEYQYSKGRKGAWQNLKRSKYEQVNDWRDTHAQSKSK
eukprot:g4052.t1